MKHSVAALSMVVLTATMPAQETKPEVVEMAPFEVTASGALTVLEITHHDLETRQANNLADALSLDPSITVGGSLDMAQKFYVRNLGEGLLNVTVDGATQSGSLFHHMGRLAFEPELLEKVEVQPGVGNASDGPGTLGGAVRFVTKDPLDLLALEQRVGGLIKAGYFSNTEGWKLGASGFARLNDDWRALISVVHQDQGNIVDGDGTEIDGSSLLQNSVLAKIVGDVGEGHTAGVSYEYIEEEGETLRRPEWAPGPANPTFPLETGRYTAGLTYGFNPEANDAVNIFTRLTYTDSDLLQIGPWGPWNGAIGSVQALAQNTQIIGRHSLVYGLDFRADEVSAGPDANPREYNEDSSVFGLFFQGNAALADQLILNFGARYDFYELNDQLDQDFTDSGLSPNIGLTYQITPEFGIIGNVATALRGPDINDAFKIDHVVNDPDMVAEEALNYELRVNYSAKGLQLEAGVYANRIDNVITNTLPWSGNYTNAGELKTDGLFARISYATKNYFLGLQHNRTDSTLDGQVATRYQYGSLVSSIGPTWVADAVWRPLAGLDLGWNGRYVEELNNIAVPEDITGVTGSTIDKPGYFVNDIYARWTPKFLDYLTVVLTIKNAFDTAYISQGSVEDLTEYPGFGAVVGALEPGRDIRLSVALRF